MKPTTLIATAVLASAALTTPGLAQEIVQQTTIISEVPLNLNRFIGQNVFGVGHANLGTVSQVDPYAGVIALTGRYGEYALISASMLVPDGLNLLAPTLTQGDIKVASNMNLARLGSTIVGPSITVVEPPLG